MTTNRKWLDTNIIIRWVTGQPDNQARQLPHLFQAAEAGDVELVIDSLVVAETVWVLEGLVDHSDRSLYTRHDISRCVAAIATVPGVNLLERSLVLEAIGDYEKHAVDFIDAYLAARVRQHPQDSVVTWNHKHFKRLSVACETP